MYVVVVKAYLRPEGNAGDLIIAMVVPTDGTQQAGCGFFKISWQSSKPPEPEKGKLNLKKQLTQMSAMNQPNVVPGTYTLKGAEYAIYKATGSADQYGVPQGLGEKVGTMVTNESGYAESGDLEVGWYWVRETISPRGAYVDQFDTSNTYSVNGQYGYYAAYVHANQSSTINTMFKGQTRDGTVKEKPWLGSIGVRKTSSRDGSALAGAEFGIWIDGVGKTWTMTTNSSGIGRWDNLPLATYWVHETKAPAGHNLKTTGGSRPPSNSSMARDYNDSGWFKVTVKENPSLSGNPYLTSDIVSWVTTDGTNFVDDAIPQGGLSINKVVTDPDTGSGMSSRNYSLAGARFKVVGPSRSGRTYYLTTDSTGRASLDDLEYGTYYITEIEPPSDGHSILDSTEYPVTVSATHKNVSFTAENEARKYGFTIAKQSDTAGDTKSLAGAQFGVYRTQSDASLGRNALETITIGSGNRGTSRQDYTIGQTVYVKETRPPDGYKMNPNVFTVTVTDSTSSVRVTVTDEKIKTPYGKIRLKKSDAADGSALAGAKFSVVSVNKVVGTDGNTYATAGQVMQKDLTTGADGTATTIDLPLNANGKADYRLVETYAPAPYDGVGTIVNVSITNGTVDTVVLKEATATNTPKTGRIRVKKVADGTETGIGGVKFDVVATRDIVMPTGKVRHRAGDVVQHDLTTGSDGTATSDELPLGRDGKGYYKVVETYAPKPYVIATKDTDATITMASGAEASYSDVVVKDKLPTGTIKVVKTDFTTGNPIPSVEFDIKAKADVTGVDGGILARANDVVGHIKTGADGTATSGQLPIGREGKATYVLVETKAAHLYPIPTETWEVTLGYKDSATQVIAGTIEIKNTKSDLFGTVKVIKVGGTEREPVPGVKFDVVATKDVIGFDGKTKATAGQVMQKDLTTGDDGTATSVRLPLDKDGKGYYKLVETYAPARYEITSKETAFTIDYATDAKETVASKDVTVENKKRPVIDGKVRVTKTDKDTAARLAGAVFEVTAKEDVTMPDGTVQAHAGDKVATITTGADGTVTSSPVPLTSTDWVNWSATYTVTETRAPNGHSITAAPQEVTITGKGSGEGAAEGGVVTVDVPFEDSPIPPARITIRKTDKDGGKAVPGARFDVVATRDMMNHDGTVKVANGTKVQEGLTTGDDGTAVSDELEVGDDGKGWYKVVETFTPKPYYLDKREWDTNVSWNGKTFGKDVSVAVDAKNAQAHARVKVKKVDENAMPVVGVKFDVVAVDDVTLPNGTVLAKAGSVVVHDLVTGEDGTATTGALPMDKSGSTKYRLVETYAPARYEITHRETEVTVTYKDMQTAEVTAETSVENHKYPVVNGKIRVAKTESGTGKGLAGAVFEVVAKTDMRMPDGTVQAEAGKRVATLTTKDDGTAETGSIPLNSTDWKSWSGTYTVTETRAPNGHFITEGPKDVTITAESGQGKPDVVAKDVSFQDDVVPPVRIEVTKADRDGGRGVPGAKFDIIASKDMLRADGTVKVAKGTKAQEGLTTGADGKAESADLQIGDDGNGWYQVVETSVPKPYILDATPHEVELRAGGKAETVRAGAKVENDAQHGRIRIVKTDKVKGHSVKGARFDVIATADVTLPTGETKYRAGDVAQHDLTTGDDGTATSEELPLGSDGKGHYKVVETHAPVPYVKGSEWDATITGAGTDKVVSLDVEVDDDVARGTLKLTKLATDDGKPIAGAVFDIVADEDVTLPDGTILYAKDAKVETITTGQDGTASTTSPLYVGADGKGRYRADEVSVPVPYVVTTKSTKFSVSYADDATIDVHAEVTVKNDTNGLRLTKTEMSRGDDGKQKAADGDAPVAGAEYRMWRRSDELAVKPDDGKVAYALRVDGGKEGLGSVTLVPMEGPASDDDAGNGDDAGNSNSNSSANANSDANEAPDANGNEVAGRDAATGLAEGNGPGNGDATNGNVNANGEDQNQDQNGNEAPGEGKVDAKPGTIVIELKDGTYVSTALDPHSAYSVMLGEREIGQVVTGDAGTVSYARYDSDASAYGYRAQPILLTDDSKFIGKLGDKDVQVMTDDDGSILIKGIPAGEYAIGEITAPVSGEGGKARTYLVDTKPYRFTVDANDGHVNGDATHEVPMHDGRTTVDISKNEITGGPEVPGAHLTLKDAAGNVADEWTSTDAPHRIDGLVPGRYTLTEVRTPRNYDQAETIEFVVYETGDVQRVEMHDEPIRIDARVDKRQEIADPVAADTDANGDGKNKADVTKSDDGRYSYSVDARSESSTWTDEFTVYDSFDAATRGYAEVDAIVTPQAYRDYDGKLNVWYQTDRTPTDYAGDAGKANATMDDGHVNPWLDGTDEEVRKRDGDGDGRILSYVGWRLWKRDVDATKATRLPVSELGLANGEHVTAVRLEYGRVEAGFTTRKADWERDGIKDEHDDMAPIEKEHADALGSVAAGGNVNEGKPKNESESSDGNVSAGANANTNTNAVPASDASEAAGGGVTDANGAGTGNEEPPAGKYAPLVVEAHVTDSYVPGTQLDNSAYVDAYRNGGGEGLEGHDQDKVTQMPKAVGVDGDLASDILAQTGDGMPAAALASAAASGAALVVVARRRRRE